MIITLASAINSFALRAISQHSLLETFQKTQHHQWITSTRDALNAYRKKLDTSAKLMTSNASLAPRLTNATKIRSGEVSRLTAALLRSFPPPPPPSAMKLGASASPLARELQH